MAPAKKNLPAKKKAIVSSAKKAVSTAKKKAVKVNSAAKAEIKSVSKKAVAIKKKVAARAKPIVSAAKKKISGAKGVAKKALSVIKSDVKAGVKNLSNKKELLRNTNSNTASTNKAKTPQAVSKKGGKPSAAKSGTEKSPPSLQPIAGKKHTADREPQAAQTKKEETPSKSPASPDGGSEKSSQDSGEYDGSSRLVIHGKNHHFIPSKDELHYIKGRERNEAEQAFKHNEEIALHQEQMKAKNNLATRQKRIFSTPRQS